MTTSSEPGCSVLICTYNRAALLHDTLESLCCQTLPFTDFEVIVVDDGSVDATRETVKAFSSRLNLRYAYQRNAGLASARNHALFLSKGKIVVLLDDDDVAEPACLQQHMLTHQEYPQDNYAVLGYTRLAPAIADDPLMHFVTEIGNFLFSYGDLKAGQVCDFSYFWGGRSSCKRRFLIRNGIFNSVFRFGCEDIELAYRLSAQDFRIVYNPRAVTVTARPITFDQFCDRLVRQGRSNFVFSRLHPDAAVQQWTEINDAERWSAIAPAYKHFLRAGLQLDALFRFKRGIGLATPDDLDLLHQAYWTAFRASKIKGMADAAAEAGVSFGTPLAK